MRCAYTFLLLAILLLSGCGGSSDEQPFLDDLGRITAEYQVLELATGEVTPHGVVDDLLQNPAYRTSHLVFRRVHGPAVVGSPDDQLGAGEDPPRESIDLPPCYLAVFELSQAQWRAIAGSEPWLELSPAAAADVAVGDDRPAVGMSPQAAVQALAAYSAEQRFTLALPSDRQWEAACRAGDSGLFAWGDSLDPASARDHARCWETAGGARGAEAVNGRLPNALGFVSMHGNAAELSAEGHARGGSWHDDLLACRSATRISLPTDTGHALVGLRLRYRLD